MAFGQVFEYEEMEDHPAVGRDTGSLLLDAGEANYAELIAHRKRWNGVSGGQEDVELVALWN